MKGSFLKQVYLLAFLFFLLFASCKKQLDTQFEETITKENFIAEAQAKFANGPVLQEKNLLDLSFSIFPKLSPKRRLARIGKLQQKIEWDKAALFQDENIKFLLLPVKGSKTLLKDNSVITRTVIFYKKKYEDLHFYILEIITKDNVQPNVKEQLARNTFLKMVFGKSEKASDANGNIFFYDEKYASISGYEVRDGISYPIASLLKPKQINSVKANQNVIIESITAENCEPWGVYHDYYENGVLVWSELLYTYMVCDGVNTEDEYGDGGGGGDNGGGDLLENQNIDGEDKICENSFKFQTVIQPSNGSGDGELQGQPIFICNF